MHIATCIVYLKDNEMLFIEYPKCTTCIRAKKYLVDHNINFVDRNIKEEKPTYEELKIWLKESKLPIRKFFNTSGLIYKELNLKDKLNLMSEEEKLHLLASNGMLVKRPIVVDEKGILIGFKEEDWKKFFLGE